MTIVEKLLRGSDEINRMQSDIRRIIKSITGLIQRDEMHLEMHRVINTDVGEQCRWVVEKLDNGTIVFEYLVLGDPAVGLFSNRPGFEFGPAAEDTQVVYGALGILVEDLTATMPHLKRRLIPFFEAAAVVEKSSEQADRKPESPSDDSLIGMLLKIEQAASDIAWYMDQKVGFPQRKSTEEDEKAYSAGCRYLRDLTGTLEVGERKEWLDRLNSMSGEKRFENSLHWASWGQDFAVHRSPTVQSDRARSLIGICRELRVSLQKETGNETSK